MSVQIEGARRLRSTLKKAGGDLKLLKDVNKAAANVVLPVAAARAPKLTGALAASVRVGATQSAGIIRAGNNRKTKAGVPYGGVIHWGWPARGIRARTFITDAAQATEPVWVALYISKMDEAVRSVKGK